MFIKLQYLLCGISQMSVSRRTRVEEFGHRGHRDHCDRPASLLLTLTINYPLFHFPNYLFFTFFRLSSLHSQLSTVACPTKSCFSPACILCITPCFVQLPYLQHLAFSHLVPFPILRKMCNTNGIQTTYIVLQPP